MTVEMGVGKMRRKCTSGDCTMTLNRTDIIREFEKIAADLGTTWAIRGSYCELTKNGIVLRVWWSIERIEGVFVTLASDDTLAQDKYPQEYGLPYLVAYRTGDPKNIHWPSRNDLEAAVEATKKYAAGLLLGTDNDYAEFASVALEIARQNVIPTPKIRATSRVRPEWI